MIKTYKIKIILLITLNVLFTQGFLDLKQNALSKYSEMCVNYYNLSKSNFQNNNKKAIKYINKAISCNNNFLEAYFLKGQIYAGMHNPEEALNNYFKVITIKSNHLWAHIKCAHMYRMYLNDFTNAIIWYTKAIKINPIDPALYSERGGSYTELKDTNKAIQDFKKAIEINPKNALSYGSLGSYYNKINEYKLALKTYNKAININPNSPFGYTGRGYNYLFLNEYKKSKMDFEKALTFNHKYPYMYLHYGLYYWVAEKDLNKTLKYFKIGLDKANGKNKYFYKEKKYKLFLHDLIEKKEFEKLINSY